MGPGWLPGLSPALFPHPVTRGMVVPVDQGIHEIQRGRVRVLGLTRGPEWLQMVLHFLGESRSSICVVRGTCPDLIKQHLGSRGRVSAGS